VATHLNTTRLPVAVTASLALAVLLFASPRAEAQVYSTQQGTPQSSSSVPCVCPFPQGYCPFPQGFCALPVGNCGGAMSSQQGTYPSAPMMPQYSYQGYYPKPYGTPTFFIPKPLGIPAESMPSSQGMAQPNPQVASSKK
jgi:hypothetical protein